MYALAVLSLLLYLLSRISMTVADFLCFKVAYVVRLSLAKVTGILPFSLAELIIVTLPVLFVGLFLFVIFRPEDEDPIRIKRFFVTAFAIVSVFFTLFVFTDGCGYFGRPLDEKLGIEKNIVSADELKDTAEYLTDRVNACAKDVSFVYGSFSVMPYSFKNMNARLNDAYDGMSKDLGFFRNFHSNLKPVVLSDAMSYAHLLGMYSYYTGESNINVHFPDYTLPYTCAHEMAHQRGISKEDEANFMAYLACVSSDDCYINYCGYLNLLEYVYNALYSADKNAYYEVRARLNPQSDCELNAYSLFFRKYEKSSAAAVYSAVNDAHLKTNGQKAGEKSYGLVVDLAVAYIKEQE